MTPTERLARAMGYETRTESPGYGRTVVLIKVGELGSWQVFDPRKDGEQGFEVLAWLSKRGVMVHDRAAIGTIAGGLILEKSDGTGPDLMRAVCDAAERVAEGMV